MVHYLLSVGLSVALLLFLTHIQDTSCRPPRQKKVIYQITPRKEDYCKFGTFREGFIFVKLCICEFPENKTLEKWQNHPVVY